MSRLAVRLNKPSFKPCQNFFWILAVFYLNMNPTWQYANVNEGVEKHVKFPPFFLVVQNHTCKMLCTVFITVSIIKSLLYIMLRKTAVMGERFCEILVNVFKLYAWWLRHLLFFL